MVLSVNPGRVGSCYIDSWISSGKIVWRRIKRGFLCNWIFLEFEGNFSIVMHVFHCAEARHVISDNRQDMRLTHVVEIRVQQGVLSGVGNSRPVRVASFARRAYAN